MRIPALGAVLSISVDLPACGNESDGARDRAAEAGERLLQLFADAALPATWFAGDPASNETLRRAIHADRGHEAALRIAGAAATPDTAAPGSAATGAPPTDAARSKPLRGLLERIAQARAAGFAISTLAISDSFEAPAELLVKYGFTAVRTSEATVGGRRDASAGLVPLRFGLWQLTPNFCLGGGGGWAHLPFSTWRLGLRIRGGIDRCIRNGAPGHLVIDAASLLGSEPKLRLGCLPAILRHIAARRSAGRLQVGTIAETVARLTAPAATRSGRSILRAA